MSDDFTMGGAEDMTPEQQEEARKALYGVFAGTKIVVNPAEKTVTATLDDALPGKNRAEFTVDTAAAGWMIAEEVCAAISAQIVAIKKVPERG
jgi:hypothetical protein